MSSHASVVGSFSILCQFILVGLLLLLPHLNHGSLVTPLQLQQQLDDDGGGGGDIAGGADKMPSAVAIASSTIIPDNVSGTPAVENKVGKEKEQKRKGWQN